MTKILITGGTGYLGRNLCNQLLTSNHQVTILSRNINSPIVSSLEEKGVLFFRGNTEDFNSLKPMVSEKFDVIFHFAANLNMDGDKDALFNINVKGTKNMLKLANKSSAAKFIFASSIEAMGPVSERDIFADETYGCSPVNNYGESKLEAEKIITANNSGFKSIIFRIGNVYGPDGRNFIYPIIASIERKNILFRALPLIASRYLSFIFIEDVIRGLLCSLSDIPSETYILTGDEQLPFGKIYDLCAQLLGKDTHDYKILDKDFNKSELLGKNALLDYILSDDGNLKIHRAYSNDKIKRKAGFRAKVDLRTGIKKTIEFFYKKGILPIYKKGFKGFIKKILENL